MQSELTPLCKYDAGHCATRMLKKVTFQWCNPFVHMPLSAIDTGAAVLKKSLLPLLWQVEAATCGLPFGRSCIAPSLSEKSEFNINRVLFWPLLAFCHRHSAVIKRLLREGWYKWWTLSCRWWSERSTVTSIAPGILVNQRPCTPKIWKALISLCSHFLGRQISFQTTSLINKLCLIPSMVSASPNTYVGNVNTEPLLSNEGRIFLRRRKIRSQPKPQLWSHCQYFFRLVQSSRHQKRAKGSKYRSSVSY